MNKPKPNRDKSVYKHLEDWVPTSWEEMWRFRARDGVTAVTFDNLHYAEFARDSYAVFRRLRDAGIIPRGPRFQVSLPLPEDFTRWCTGTDRDFSIMSRGVEDALGREVDKILQVVPADDLAIQWDVCWEVFACAANDYLGREPLAWRASGDPFERFAGYIRTLSPRVAGCRTPWHAPVLRRPRAHAPDRTGGPRCLRAHGEPRGQPGGPPL